MADRDGVMKEKPRKVMDSVRKTTDEISRAVIDKVMGLQASLTKEVNKVYTKNYSDVNKRHRKFSNRFRNDNNRVFKGKNVIVLLK